MKIDPRYLEDKWLYSHGHYSTHKGGAMCSRGRYCSDGYMTTFECPIKGDYARCEICEHNDDWAMFVDIEDK